VPAEFGQAMDDDFGVATALGVLHERVRVGNSAMGLGDGAGAQAALDEVLAMTSALGIDPRQWTVDTGGADLGAVLDIVLEQREQARVRKDFSAADQIRKQLASAGVEVEDTAAGPRWTLRRTSTDDKDS
jgi:cysteinyl-tRNA synthetase